MQLTNSVAAAACDRNGFRRSTTTAHHMPGEVLEQLLAHLPFRERCGDSLGVTPPALAVLMF